MASHVLTLDLGSSGMRAAVVATDGWGVKGQARRGYRVTRSESGLALHYGPAVLRARIVDCLAEAIREAHLAPDGIGSVSITAQRGGTAFLDTDGRTLYVGPNRDVRAVFEGSAIDDALAGEVYATTGHLPSMFFVPAKVHWWREHHPRIARRIASVASLGAWAAHELTGELRETTSTLVEAGLADVGDGQPAAALLARLDIGLDALPTIVSEGAPTGGLAREAANAIGLAAGTPVVLAGPDAQVAALGAGCVAPGDIVVMAGWSAPVQRVTKRPMPDGARRTWVVRHPVDGRWASEANPGDTGGTLDMVRRLLGPRMSPLRLDRLAASAPRTDLSVYALWGPRALDLSNPGMSLGGLLTPSPVTYEGIGAAQVARATLENIAYAIRECVELLAEVCGAGANEVALTGGMANSEVFAEMLATTLGCTVRRHDAQGAAIGAAIVASLGRDEWAKAAAAMVDRGEAVHPGGDVVETNERYGRWLRLRAGLDALADEV